MPRLNSRGNVLCGVAGGHASIDGRVISQTFGASAGWVNDDTAVFRGTIGGVGGIVICGSDTRLAIVRSATGLAAGGGRYLAQDASGVFGAIDLAGYSLGLLGDDERGAAGPDGSFALVPHGGRGLELRSPTGARDLIADVIARDVQIVGPRQAHWRDDAGRIHVYNLPQPVQLPTASRVRWVNIPGQAPWIVSFCSLIGIVAHPIDSLVGVVLNRGAGAFYHDPALVNGQLMVVWSTGQGEGPGESVVVPDVFALPRVDLMQAIQQPPIIVPPVIVPPTEPVSMRLPDRVFATLVRLRPQFPTPLGDQGAALLNAVAYEHREEGFGLEAKPGGTTCAQPTTGSRCGCDILRTTTLGWDVLGDAEGAGSPVQADSGPADPGRFVSPVKPVGQPQPPDPGVPPSSGLDARVATLEAAQAVMARDIADLRATMPTAVKAEVTRQLALLPPSGPLPKDIVLLSDFVAPPNGKPKRQVKVPVKWSGVQTGTIEDVK